MGVRVAVVVMPVIMPMMMVMMVMVPMTVMVVRFLVQPAADVGDLAAGIVKSIGEEGGTDETGRVDIYDACPRIERGNLPLHRLYRCGI